MNKVQLALLWLIGLAVSFVFSSTGLKLLDHAAKVRETWENGYPLTLLAGTAWTYIIPIVIIGGLLVYTGRGIGKRKK